MLFARVRALPLSDEQRHRGDQETSETHRHTCVFPLLFRADGPSPDALDTLLAEDFEEHELLPGVPPAAEGLIRGHDQIVDLRQ